MTELPDILLRGDRARLFPVLAETSKEGRTLSIFLSCFGLVPELRRALLGSIGVRTGKRADIETYTEVVLKKGDAKGACRPDGLIVVKTSSGAWTALVEAKVGNADLTKEQINAYAEVARLNNVDALITLSNQFASLPTHHPVQVAASLRKKLQLFHWSWMYVLTQSTLLLSEDDLGDREQRLLLKELNRFLLHPSSGVKGFDQMPASWSDAVATVHAGGVIPVNSPEATEIIGAWHQEIGDLCLILSRQLEIPVKVRLPRAHVAAPADRQKADQMLLSKEGRLLTQLEVPDTADEIQVCVDLRARLITASMWIKAPTDRKSAKARLNWLMRQLPQADLPDIYIRCHWPGRAGPTQYRFDALRENLDLVSAEREGQNLLSFEVLLVRAMAGNLAKRKVFITELESLVPEYYRTVAQHLKAWQPKAPKLDEARAQPDKVAPKVMREEAELEALTGEV